MKIKELWQVFASICKVKTVSYSFGISLLYYYINTLLIYYAPRKKYNRPIEKVYFINYIVIIDAKYKQGGEYEGKIIDSFGIIIGNIFITSINCMGSSSVCR